MEPKQFKASGARAVVEALKLFNVERVFGLPGIQNLELFDELADAPFETVTTTDERSAAFMADAHARVTGKLGVLIVTAGPGLTNALTGLAEALLDSSPVLILVDSKQSAQGKAFQLHQIAQDEVVKPLVKELFESKAIEEIPGLIAKAAALARAGEPGPVLVEIPSELFMSSALCSFAGAESIEKPSTDESQLDAAAEVLRQSPSIGIYAGFGAIEAATELIQLAELLQAPVATTISGRGVIPEDHPLSVGYGFGRTGTAVAWKLFRKVHTVLAVGCKYGEVATGSYGAVPPAEHIHIDINSSTLNTNYPASIAVVSDAKRAIQGLLKRLGADNRQVNEPLYQLIEQARGRDEAKALQLPMSTQSVHPSRLLRSLRKQLDRDAILITDCGNHQFWALSDFLVYVPRSFLSPTDYQSMGFSIPAAIAAKLAHPDKQVVSLVGDGGFAMSGFECLTAVKRGAKIIVIIFRDGAWGLLKDAQRRLYRRAPFTDIPNPDFKQLAGAFGMRYVPVENDLVIESGLSEAIAAKESCLVDVNVRYDESSPYVKGAAFHMYRSLPLRIQAKIGMRLARRLIFKS